MSQFYALLLALGTWVAQVFAPAPPPPTDQKALVYCPVGIDESGCNTIVDALSATFAAVHKGYDGSDGTVDLSKPDSLFQYAVIVVPSLADGGSAKPYDLLRNATVAHQLHDALMGRRAFWSGTPDQGSTNRDAKNTLIRNLASWAAGNYGTVQGPGLVVLLDQSATASARYNWVAALTGLTITADPNLQIPGYSKVLTQSDAGAQIVGQLGYDNIATYGFFAPQGGAGLSMDAVGQTGTSQGGQVVLMTHAGGNTGGAVVFTDRDDYAPGDTVTITGSGFGPSETVTLTFHEDPLVDQDRVRTVTSDPSGGFVYRGFAPESHDIGVRFILTAKGGTSGKQAQATFTDAVGINSVSVSPASRTVDVGDPAVYTVTVKFTGNGGVGCAATLSVTGLPAGATATWSPSASISATSGGDTLRTLSIGTTAVAASSSLTISVAAPDVSGGAGCNGATKSTTATLTVTAPAVQDQSITFGDLPNRTYGDAAFTLSATGGGSGNPVTFALAASSAGCSLAGDNNATVTIAAATGDGQACQITASQAAGPGYNAAPPVTRSFTIAPKALTVMAVAEPTSTTYPASPSFSATYAGFVTGETETTAGVLGGALAFEVLDGSSTPVTTTPIPAGSYTLRAKGLTAANYAISYQDGSFTIGKANQTITFAQPASPQTYGAAFNVGPTASSGLPVSVTGTPGVCTVAPTAAGTFDVTMVDGTGSCVLTASQPGDDNYDAATAAEGSALSYMVVAAKASLTVKVKDKSITFGQASPAFDAEFAGFVLTDNASSVGTPTFTFVGVSPTVYLASTTIPVHAGTYTVTPGGLTSTKYSFSYQDGTFAIGKATPTVTVDWTGGVYSGSAFPATANVTGVGGVAIATPTLVLEYYSGSTASGAPLAGAPVDAGTYTVRASFAGNDDYDAAFCDETIVIDKAIASVTFSNLTHTYDGTSKEATYTTSPQINGGNLTGVAVTYSGSDNFGANYGPSPVGPTNAGTYTVNATLDNTNYKLAAGSDPTTAQFTISKADQTVTFVAPTSPQTYAATFNVNPTASSGLPVTLTGTAGVCSVTAAAGGYDVKMLTGTGTCTLTASQPGNGNYNAATAAAGSELVHTVEAQKALLSVKANDQTITYKDASPTFEVAYAGFVNGDDDAALGGALAFTFAGIAPTVYAASTTAPTNAGSYSITPGGFSSTNYSFDYQPGTFTIDKATPVISWTNPADIVYGTALGATQLDAAASYKSEDIPGSFVYSPAAGALLNAGNGQDLSVAFTPTDAANYNGAQGVVKINVLKAPVTVTAVGGTYTYDATTHPATATVVGVSGGTTPDPSAVTFTYNGDGAPPKDAGTYADVATFAGDANYLPGSSSNAAFVVIQKADPTVSVTDETVTYDAQPHAAHGSVTGVGSPAEPLGDPTFEYLGTSGTVYPASADAPTNAGTYQVTASFGGNGNYNPASRTATLTINKATPAFSDLAGPTIVYQTTSTQLSGTLKAGALAATGSVSITLNGAAQTVEVGPDGTFNANFATGALLPSGSPYTITFAYSATQNFKAAIGSASLTVTNNAPVVTQITLNPAPVAVNTPVSISAAFTDEDGGQNHTATIKWDDGSTTAGSVSPAMALIVTGSHTYTQPGVYTVMVTVTDGAAEGSRSSSSETPAYIVVYDPSAGFVTGGGWIDSPAGACALASCTYDTTGKATFGFVAKYQKGANVPTGNTEFQFHAGDLNFKATSYQWLVVSGSNKAQYKGFGTINGAGTYQFLVTAIQGSGGKNPTPDQFRIKIMNGSTTVYDNKMGADEDSSAATILGGGSINIQAK